MPGTIQVSVLDFTGLQSSQASLQVSVKISMGKKEYSTSDKGEFSFPLANLRDNLVVALQDAEGNEISNAGIETRLVIEKGVWDDIFSLEGGGHVHMKLQFLLNEEDRQRIRNMRESALRKKHDEFPNSVLESPEHNVTASSSVAFPSRPSSEASEPQKPLLQDELVMAQAGTASMSRLTLTNKGKVGPEDVERSRSDQMQNNKDRPGDAEALLQQFNVLSKEVSPSCAVEKTATVDSPKSEVPEKPNGDRANYHNKRISLNKTPTNVREMITVFESSQNQDMKPQIRPSSIRYQTRKTWVEADPNSSQLNEARTKENIPVQSLSGNFRSLLLTDEDVQQGTACIQDNEEQNRFVRTLSSTSSLYAKKSVSRGECLPTKEKYVYFKNNYTAMDHEVDIEKEGMSSEKLIRASTSERASARGRTLHEHTSVSGNSSCKRGQGSNLLTKENAKASDTKGSQGYLNFRGASGDSNYLLESLGGWTFPDGGGKRLCLTAGGKRLMNLTENLSTDKKNPTGKTNFSGAENMKKCNLPGATRLVPNGSEEISQRPRKTNSGDSTDSETSIGPLGQVMKVAIMVGFATLVLFTRQRNTDR